MAALKWQFLLFLRGEEKNKTKQNENREEKAPTPMLGVCLNWLINTMPRTLDKENT